MCCYDDYLVNRLLKAKGFSLSDPKGQEFDPDNNVLDGFDSVV